MNRSSVRLVLFSVGTSSRDVTGPRLRAVGAVFLVRRPFVVAPAIAMVLGLLYLSGAPGRQLLALTVGCSVMLGFFVFEALYFRRRPVTERHLLGSLLFTATGLVGACFGTGSIRSPFVPLLFAPTVTAFAAFGRTRESAVTLGWLLLLLGGLTLLPGGPFPPIAAPWVEWMTLVAAVASALLLNLGVSGLTGAYADTARQLAEARQEMLEVAEARAARWRRSGPRSLTRSRTRSHPCGGWWSSSRREPRTSGPGSGSRWSWERWSASRASFGTTSASRVRSLSCGARRWT